MDINKLCPYCLNEINTQGETCSICGKNIHEEQEITHHLKPFSILQGKYLVGGILGEGGFGITYVGLDINLENKVAIKEFYPNGYCTRDGRLTSQITAYTGENQDIVTKWRDNFLKEARALARCENLSGVVGVKDFFQENNTAYIVQEFLNGVTLKEVIKESGGKIAPEIIIPAMEPVITALAKVHEQGIIHRDISPDNIMCLHDGRMKLIDFGAARDFNRRGDKSLSVLLKPGYAPEEQYRTKGDQGPWSDIYALAATVYKCLTGVTPPEALERIRVDELAPISSLGINIEPYQEAAILKAMAVSAQERFQTMDEFRRALYDPGYMQTIGAMNQPAGSMNQTVAVMNQPVDTMSQNGGNVPAYSQNNPNKNKPGKPENKNTSLLPIIIAAGVVAIAVIVVGAAFVIKNLGSKKSASAAAKSVQDGAGDYEISVHEDAEDNSGLEINVSDVETDLSESNGAAILEDENSGSEESNTGLADSVPWAAAYRDYVALHDTWGYSFAYIYVNDDDIPELVLQGQDEATGCLILTYGKDHVAKLQTCRLEFTYRERENLLNNSGGHMGGYYDKIYRITDGEWESVAVGEYYVENNVGDWSEEDLIYEWNGMTVSADEYASLLNEVYPSQGACYTEYYCSRDEILSMLEDDIARTESMTESLQSGSERDLPAENITITEDMRNVASLVIPCFLNGQGRSIVFKDASYSDIEAIMRRALGDYAGEKFYADYVEDGCAKISKEYADKCVKDLLGCAGVNWNSMGELSADDYTVYVMMAGGEWQYMTNPLRAQKKGDYIYVSGTAATGNDIEEYYLGDFCVKMKECGGSAFGYTLVEANFVPGKNAVSSASASSTLAPQSGHSYEAGNAIDNDDKTAWVEGVGGLGIGESITIYLNKMMYVSGIKLANGYRASSDLYNKNGRIAGCRIETGDGKSFEYIMDDIPELIYSLNFSEPCYTDKITLYITDAVAGTKYEDVCISGIEVNTVEQLAAVE